VYLGTDLIATWGLNLQFGVTGVLNLAYIVEVAMGAYIYAVFTLGPASANGGFQTYIIGLHWPIAAAIAAAVVAGAVAGGLIGLIGNRRLRPDYQAVALLVVAVVAVTTVEADGGLFNGNAGLTLIPNPLGGTGPISNPWGYVVLVAVLAAASYLLLRRLTDGPMGRTLRAVRDDDKVAASIGKNVIGLRIMVQCVGGAFAGLSGALLVGFVGAWSPSAWQYIETMALLIAVIVGGTGNNWGVALGTLIVPVAIQQGTQFIPVIGGQAGLAEDIGWMLLGLLAIVFIWLRPDGLLAERRPKYAPRLAQLASATAPKTPARPRGSAPTPVAAAAAAATSVALLEARDLVVRFGGVHAVDGASWSAARGQVTGLIGPNGAGKSTVINVISGFQRPDAGQVLFDGKDVTGLSPEKHVHHGLVRTFQLPRGFRRLTVVENLLVAAQHQRSETWSGVLLGRRHWGPQEEQNLGRTRDLLAMFEMADKADEYAGNLSGGQTRMLELMRTLMADPLMLLLDEPLAGLSGRWSGILEQALAELKAQGLSFVLVEHELGIVERLSDTVVVMALGRVLSRGAMSDLRGNAEVQAAYVIG
jgi:ABC-type branched-subunit amino acid transport system ATPase component/ABC-type branched-subunit amino acid transport system permease subunit